MSVVLLNCKSIIACKTPLCNYSMLCSVLTKTLEMSAHCLKEQRSREISGAQLNQCLFEVVIVTFFYPKAGQIKAKAICLPLILPKNEQTNLFCLLFLLFTANKTNSLGNSMARQSCLRFYLTFR